MRMALQLVRLGEIHYFFLNAPQLGTQELALSEIFYRRWYHTS